ncbi:glycosyltransferase family 4 protein [Nitrolancea hollandica]|uniref:glycosyltransferase family 4 protein n=1 Tax=Nitrolancea hollandica TaxID=1206749 RepID=UPI0002F324B1|nr:glycosyltransferase family 1 protein [Nitrolancea hollandica]
MANGRPLTIAIDASRAATGQLTGTERYSRQIIEAMIAAGRNHRYLLYLNQAGPIDLALPATARQRPIPFPRLWTHVRLSVEILRQPVDALFIPAHVVPPVHPRATVVTIHDLGYLYEPDSHTAWSRRYLDWSTRWSVAMARRIIAISGATRDDLVRHYGAAPEKIRVIPHGIDEGFHPLQQDVVAREVRRLGFRQPYILFVGTIQPRKNVARLIAAFDILADSNRELELVLAGKRGWLAERIDAAIQSSRHRDRIRITGHVPDASLPALYNGAEAVVLPSLYEGFGLPALEAMASGTPVVVSNRGALPGIAGDAALVVDPLSPQAIAAGLTAALDPATRARRIEAGIQHAARFRWTTAGQQTLEVIEEAAGITRKAAHGQ